jgi:hypothetical protein
VIDASTKDPLPFCNVFINNSTLGATTDTEGNFVIRAVPVPGAYEIIVSYVGYESVGQKIDISDAVTLRPIQLKPSQTELSTVEVQSSRDKTWEKKLKRFSKIFIGDDKQASQCTILNPWVIDFPVSKNQTFTATASLPIEIENKALGYKIRFILVSFSASATNYSITGKSFFEELFPQSYEEATRWRNERARSYQNSRQHLFKAIVNRRVSGSGLKLYSEVDKTPRSRGDFFYRELGKSVMPSDTVNMVVNGSEKNVFAIRINTRLEIHNVYEKDKASIYRDMLHPVSFIESRSGLIYVNKEGFEMNSSDAIAFGAMNELRVSRLVPTDYQPPARLPGGAPEPDEIAFAQEKIYVQTDKPYYYAGETIWFKGYVRYRTQSLRDSLSTTVYAELVNADGKVAASKMLEIVNSSFQNDFALPDTIATGDYFLRCYTNMNRNFGNDKLYIKYTPVFALREIATPALRDTTDLEGGMIMIESAKKTFNFREKIELELLPGIDIPGILAGANLSISVTDMSQVVPVNLNQPITEELQLGPKPTGLRFSHPIERGFGFRGNYSTPHGNAKKFLHVFQAEPKHYTITQTDKDGNFSVGGLSFYDSSWVSILPNGASDGDFDVTVWQRDIPPVFLPARYSKPKTLIVGTPPPAHGYRTDGVTMLNEVEVRAKRINVVDQVKRPYGRPDYILSGNDIRKDPNANLLLALQGRIPGLMIRQFHGGNGGNRPDGKWYVYLSRNSGVGRRPPEVLISVNDNLMVGTPEEILITIRASTVESVELTRRTDVLFSNRGSDGMLSIYTNADLPQESSAEKILVYGYAKHRAFQSPDYKTQVAKDATHDDFRSTIYWNPNITLDETGKAHVEFYAADIKSEYMVVVEGITTDGQPIRAEKIITIVGGN